MGNSHLRQALRKRQKGCTRTNRNRPSP